MRRRLAQLVVAAVAGWPLVTLALARVADVDPWKLFSFGMYATPSRMGAAWQVQVLLEGPAGWVPFVPDDEASTRAMGDFIERRRTLGRLVSSRPLADLVMSRISAPRVAVVVHHLELDDDDRLVERSERDVYERLR